MDFLESQKIIEARSIRLASRECELLNDFPETLVVYLETEYSPVLHHFIQRNLSALEGLYKKREQGIQVACIDDNLSGKKVYLPRKTTKR